MNRLFGARGKCRGGEGVGFVEFVEFIEFVEFVEFMETIGDTIEIRGDSVETSGVC